MTNPLSHRAVLVTLNQRAWKGKAADRELAAQTEMNSNAESGSMTVIKELTPKHIIQPIRDILRIGRQEHYKMTSPGLLRGQHLLPTSMFETYMMVQGEMGDQFFHAVNDFLGVYPDIRSKARVRFGTAFKERDFPDTERMREYFGYNFYPSPVPEVSDWRLDGVDPKEIADMKATINDSVEEMFREAATALYERVRESMENLMRQAKNWSAKAPGAMLRDPTIDMVKELSEMVCDMNVTNDPVLDKIGKEMLKEFANLSGHELRRDADLRDKTAKAAQRILNKMVAQKKAA